MTLSENSPTSFENQNNCFSEDPQTCPTCGGEMCPHDICSANWCGMDDECPECYAKEQRELDAEAEAQFWSHPGWKEVFGEDQ